MKQPKQFWEFKDSVERDGSQLILDGQIAGEESWWGDVITPKEFRQQLKQVKGDLTVIINSPGGDVFAGVSIYNALREFDGDVTIRVDGLAASIASIIAMAGDKVVMNPGSMMMIHKPWTFAMGNTDELEKIQEILAGIEESLIPIYATRTGKSEAEITELLNAETWMTADEAVEMGFADEAIEAKSGSSQISNVIKNLFDGNLAFSMKATEESYQKFADKVKAQEEAKPVDEVVEDEEVVEEPTPAPAPAETPVEGEKPVEEPSEEEVTETPAEEIKDKTVVKEHKEMTKPVEHAKDQVIAPADQADVTPQATASAYLKSKKALVDFANVLKDTAGKSSEVVRDAWKDVLIQNGLTDPDYFTLPEPVITRILDAVKTSGIYNVVTKTGLDVFKAVWDDADEDADTSRAGGHKKGDTKDEQVLDFDDRVLRAKYIYKYLTLDKETIRENQSTGALIRFVLNELPIRVIREIERAIVIGDGRASGNKRHITSFISVKSDVVADNAFATSYEPVPGDSKYATILKAMDLLEAEGGVYLVSKKGYLTDLKLEQGVNGGFLWMPGTSPLDALGIEGEFRPKWFKDATDADFDAYLVVFSAYYTVGDDSVEAFTNFKLETNEEEFLQEIYAGGGLVAPLAAVGIAKSGS